MAAIDVCAADEARPVWTRGYNGFVATLVTFVGYMVGSGHAFGYDAAVTMENFVDGPPSWALTRQVVWNNHPAFSLLESLAADVLGTNEVAMRLLPALFASAAVGVLVWRVGARWGIRSGAAAGLVTATHPVLTEMSRDVRGYSLAVLCIVLMGVAVVDVRSPRLFAGAAAMGIGSHLYAAIPFLALAAVLVASGRWTSRWRVASLSALVGATVVRSGTIVTSLQTHSDRVFRPSFPLDASRAVLGQHWPVVVVFGTLAVAGMTCMSWTRAHSAAATIGVVGVVVPWLVGPHHPYPRFAYWAVPALAILVAAFVRRHPRALAAVAIGSALALAPALPSWGDDSIPNRALASQMDEATCVAPVFTSEALQWYAPPRPVHCNSFAFLGHPDMLAGGSRLHSERHVFRTGWFVECWAGGGSEIRAERRADCPADGSTTGNSAGR